MGFDYLRSYQDCASYGAMGFFPGSAADTTLLSLLVKGERPQRRRHLFRSAPRPIRAFTSLDTAVGRRRHQGDVFSLNLLFAFR
jgi:hypothetical protein